MNLTFAYMVGLCLLATGLGFHYGSIPLSVIVSGSGLVMYSVFAGLLKYLNQGSKNKANLYGGH